MPSTINTTCNGVVFVAATSIAGAEGGSLSDADLSITTSAPEVEPGGSVAFG